MMAFFKENPDPNQARNEDMIPPYYGRDPRSFYPDRDMPPQQACGPVGQAQPKSFVGGQPDATSVTSDYDKSVKDQNVGILALRRDLAWALMQLNSNFQVCRKGWNGKGMYIQKVQAILPYEAWTMMRTAQGTFIPWLCSQADFYAQDWEIRT